MTGAAFAQGTVTWNAIPLGSITAQTNTAIGTMFGGGTGTGGQSVGYDWLARQRAYYYELLYTTYSWHSSNDSSLSVVAYMAGYWAWCN